MHEWFFFTYLLFQSLLSIIVENLVHFIRHLVDKSFIDDGGGTAIEKIWRGLHEEKKGTKIREHEGMRLGSGGGGSCWLFCWSFTSQGLSMQVLETIKMKFVKKKLLGLKLWLFIFLYFKTRYKILILNITIHPQDSRTRYKNNKWLVLTARGLYYIGERHVKFIR